MELPPLLCVVCDIPIFFAGKKLKNLNSSGIYIPDILTRYIHWYHITRGDFNIFLIRFWPSEAKTLRDNYILAVSFQNDHICKYFYQTGLIISFLYPLLLFIQPNQVKKFTRSGHTVSSFHLHYIFTTRKQNKYNWHACSAC